MGSKFTQTDFDICDAVLDLQDILDHFQLETEIPDAEFFIILDDAITHLKNRNSSVRNEIERFLEELDGQ